MSGKKRTTGGSAERRIPSEPAPLKRWVLAVFGIIAVLWIAGGFFPRERTWGFSHAAYLPPYWTLLILLVGFLVLRPQLRMRLVRGYGSLSRVVAGMARVSRVLLGIACALCGGAAMYLLPITASLLGDSYLYTSELVRIADGAPIRYVSYHTLISPLVFFKLGSSMMWWFQLAYPREVFRLLTALLGVFYIGGLLWHVGRGTRDAWDMLLLGGLTFGCGALVFFFGYIEFYAPLSIATACFAFSLYASLSRNASLWMPAIWLAVAVLCHFSAICMLPALLWAFARRRLAARNATVTPARFFIALPGIALLCAVAYALDFVPRFLDHRQVFLIPLQESLAQGKYTLFSAAHLLDIPNIVLLTGGIAPVVVLVLSTGIAGRIRWELPVLQVFALLAFFWFLLALFFNPLLGMARDWDIYAPFGIALAVLAFAMVESLDAARERRAHTAVALAILSIIVSFSWIGINIREASAVPRYYDMLRRDELLVHPDFAQYGYLNLDKYYLRRKEYTNSAHMVRRMVELRAYPWDFRRFSSVLPDVREKAAVLPDIDAVVGLLLRKSPDSLFIDCAQDATASDSSEYIADQLVRLFHDGSEVPFTSERLRDFARADPRLPQAAIIAQLRGARPSTDISSFRAVMEKYEHLRYHDKPVLSAFLHKIASLRFGHYYATRSQFDSAAAWYEKYYAIDSSNIQMLNDYASVSMKRRDGNMAELLLRRALQLDPEFAETHFNSALFLLAFRNDKTNARVQLEAFLRRSNDRALRARADEILRQIGAQR